MATRKDSTSLKDTLTSLFPLLEKGLYERQRELRMSLLAALAEESVFLQGRPGTAKSLLARRLQTAFSQARCFDYLMGRFSTPEELFGPLSIKALKEDDRLVRRTQGYLPEADIVFLDEIWKASPPIQNILLTALNEKIFRNGDQESRLPLKLLMAASNEGPPDEASWAFWDRFLIRLHVGPLRNPDHVRMLLSDQDDPYLNPVPEDLRISQKDWEYWTGLREKVEMDADTMDILVWMRSEIARLHLDAKAPYISDRRWKKAAGLVRACAVCHDRPRTWPGDAWVVLHALWDKPEEYDVVRQAWHQAMLALGDGKVLGDLLEGQKELRNEDAGLDQGELETEIEEAWVVEGEYLLLDIPGETRELRIWQDDLKPLARNSGEGLVEVFFYRQGVFLESRELSCRQTGWELEFVLGLDPEAGMDTPPVKATIRSRKVMAKAKKAAVPDAGAENRHARALEGFMGKLETARNLLLQDLEASREAASGHFFLPPEELGHVTSIFSRRLEKLARLEAQSHGQA